MLNSALPARADDSDTSYGAARKAAIGASQVRPVDPDLDFERGHGPLTRDEPIDQGHRPLIVEPDTPRASGSGIGTRLRELRRASPIAEDPKKGQSTFGHSTKHPVAVDPDAPAADIADIADDTDAQEGGDDG